LELAVVIFTFEVQLLRHFSVFLLQPELLSALTLGLWVRCYLRQPSNDFLKLRIELRKKLLAGLQLSFRVPQRLLIQKHAASCLNLLKCLRQIQKC
jgi:hypothetical protein